MSDAPIKACDFCNKQGKMPTYQNGMTICWDCQKALPATMQDALHEITTLRAQLAQSEARADSYMDTFVAIADYLGIDPEAARKIPGKPSGVFIRAILRLQAEAVEDGKRAIAEIGFLAKSQGEINGQQMAIQALDKQAQRLRQAADDVEGGV